MDALIGLGSHYKNDVCPETITGVYSRVNFRYIKSLVARDTDRSKAVILVYLIHYVSL